jgi:hypothetical protein
MLRGTVLTSGGASALPRNAAGWIHEPTSRKSFSMASATEVATATASQE